MIVGETYCNVQYFAAFAKLTNNVYTNANDSLVLQVFQKDQINFKSMSLHQNKSTAVRFSVTIMNRNIFSAYVIPPSTYLIKCSKLCAFDKVCGFVSAACNEFDQHLSEFCVVFFTKEIY